AALAAAAVFTIPYALLGIRRLATGGLTLFTDDTIVNFMAWQSLNPSTMHAWGYGLLVLDYPAIAPLFKVGFAVITMCEVLSPLILINQQFRRLWILVVVPFHVATLMTMNIAFVENCVLILLLYTSFAY